VARFAALMGLAALVAGLWVFYGLAGDYRVFGGMSTANAVLWAAWLATAMLLVFGIGHLVFGVGFTLLDREATGLQRGIIYGVLTFVVVSIILGSLGMNISAILTTSVVATAIVGLAVQPTLGSLIAGSALHLDRVLRVGDVILVDNERIEVVSLNWRAIVGRKHGSTIVVIPNSHISDRQIDIIRGDRPVRSEVVVPAPLSVPPHRIIELLSEAAYDLSYVDPALPVRVAPVAYQAIEGYVNYRIRYWVLHSYDVTQARAALLSRVWYVFQREDIPWPVSSYFIDVIGPVRLPATAAFKGLRLDRFAPSQVPGMESIVLESSLSPDLATGVITDCGPPLCYCDEELLVLPRRVDGFSLFLLADGEVREAPQDTTWHASSSLGGEPWLRHEAHSGRRMAIERIAAHLARHIGPYAQQAVREAATTNVNPIAVRTAVAAEIEDPEARQNFVRGLRLEDDETYKPGFIFGLQSATYLRVSSPSLRAVGGAVIIPIVLETASPGPPVAKNGTQRASSG
jgi:small-conductance mechanosensitive channel